MVRKYNIPDIEKTLAYFKKNCQAAYLVFEFDDRDRMIVKGMDIGGNLVTVTIFDEATQKFPEVTKTERL